MTPEKFLIAVLFIVCIYQQIRILGLERREDVNMKTINNIIEVLEMDTQRLGNLKSRSTIDDWGYPDE